MSVAQDDVAVASFVMSQEGKKWSRTCYQISNICVPCTCQDSPSEADYLVILA